jgi:hypothetical protein
MTHPTNLQLFVDTVIDPSFIGVAVLFVVLGWAVRFPAACEPGGGIDCVDDNPLALAGHRDGDPMREVITSAWAFLVGRAQVLRVTVRRAVCGIHGHDSLLNVEEHERVSLLCTSCGHQTPGWDVPTKPLNFVKPSATSAAPARLTRAHLEFLSKRAARRRAPIDPFLAKSAER